MNSSNSYTDWYTYSWHCLNNFKKWFCCHLLFTLVEYMINSSYYVLTYFLNYLHVNRCYQPIKCTYFLQHKQISEWRFGRSVHSSQLVGFFLGFFFLFKERSIFESSWEIPNIMRVCVLSPLTGLKKLKKESLGSCLVTVRTVPRPLCFCFFLMVFTVTSFPLCQSIWQLERGSIKKWEAAKSKYARKRQKLEGLLRRGWYVGCRNRFI